MGPDFASNGPVVPSQNGRPGIGPEYSGPKGGGHPAGDQLYQVPGCSTWLSRLHTLVLILSGQMLALLLVAIGSGNQLLADSGFSAPMLQVTPPLSLPFYSVLSFHTCHTTFENTLQLSTEVAASLALSSTPSPPSLLSLPPPLSSSS